MNELNLIDMVFRELAKSHGVVMLIVPVAFIALGMIAFIADVRDWGSKKRGVTAVSQQVKTVAMTLTMALIPISSGAAIRESTSGIFQEFEEMHWETASLCTVIALVVIAITTRIIYREMREIDKANSQNGLPKSYPVLFVVSRFTTATATIGVVYEVYKLFHWAGIPPPVIVFLVIAFLFYLYYLALCSNFRTTK